jgi:hypothetical protein
MSALDDLSPASADVIFEALDYAVENAGISEQGFTPFAFLDSAEGRQLLRFVAGDGNDLAGSLAAGRESLQVVEPDVTCVALAWDGFLTYQGQRSEAVFVEGCEMGRDKGVLLAQRYVREEGQVVTQGNPVLVNQPAPLARHVDGGAGDGNRTRTISLED